MKVVLLFNPIAGSGKARVTAESVDRELQRAGHSCVFVATQTERPAAWLDRQLVNADVLAVIGGDGAVRIGADAAIRIGTPIYHLPFGTENLFAREFGMRRDTSQFVRALEHFKLRTMDVGLANGHLFLLMVSIGLDAEVITELTRARRGSISHLAYAKPIITQLMRWRPQPIDVRADGSVVTSGTSGWVIVANCKQYGMRLDFARRAQVDDGLLDVLFMPVRSVPQAVRWLVAARAGLHLRSGSLLYCTARTVDIATAEPQHVQLDGDLPRHAWTSSGGDEVSANDPINPTSALHVCMRRSALRVLLPA